MRLSNLILCATLAGGIGATTGCDADARAADVLGPQAVPQGYAAATVQQLVEQDNWKDQQVLFTGTINKVGCASCGGVIVADKTWRISCEPADPKKFKIPARPGSTIRVWGVLKVDEDGFRQVKAQRVELGDSNTGARS